MPEVLAPLLMDGRAKQKNNTPKKSSRKQKKNSFKNTLFVLGIFLCPYAHSTWLKSLDSMARISREKEEDINTKIEFKQTNMKRKLVSVSIYGAC